MANYYAYARSNYFLVTDVDAFRTLCKRWNLEPINVMKDGTTRYGFLCLEGIPNCVIGNDGSIDEDCDLDEELAEILADDEVVVIQEVGHENLRYLVGVVRAFNNKPDSPTIHWSDRDVAQPARELTARMKLCSEAEQVLIERARLFANGLPPVCRPVGTLA